MGRAHISWQKEASKTRTQMQAFRDHAGLEAGLPCPLPVLQASVDELAVLVADQQQLKKALVSATQKVQAHLRKMRAQRRANVANAALTHGANSEPLLWLGAKPNGGGRGIQAAAGVGTPPAPPAEASGPPAVDDAA